MDEIENKVANSKLVVFDLEDYFPKEEVRSLDISQFLFEGFILKEKDFREQLKSFNWEQFENKYVAIYCGTDAILPAWTFALVSSYLFANSIASIQGTVKDMIVSIYSNKLQSLDFSIYNNVPVILKGCSAKPVPQEIYVLATQKLIPFAKSIMFGEACSAVPLFKRK
ncbi:DUF2480 family protein [Flavobacterium sp.]|jgi:hypothetical protein|uniref:DUF2480 family protein n=1 Tax=Flavobacterium sp. TaxID=239 RepID=UPI002A7FC873|nr:DUF2480 family protein [Flavobacterium sp.]